MVACVWWCNVEVLGTHHSGCVLLICWACARSATVGNHCWSYGDCYCPVALQMLAADVNSTLLPM